MSPYAGVPFGIMEYWNNAKKSLNSITPNENPV
jgi:hypothetical protein